MIWRDLRDCMSMTQDLTMWKQEMLENLKICFFSGLCLPKLFLKAFISVNRKFKPWIEFILNLHLCNQSAIEIIQAAFIWNDPRGTNHKEEEISQWYDFFLGVVQLDILISLAGWEEGREGSSHYGGITARQPWCEQHTPSTPFCFWGIEIFDPLSP